MKSLLFFLAMCCSATACSSNEAQDDWYLLHPENGCVPFDEGSGEAATKNVKNPNDLLHYLRAEKLPDAEMLPFMEYLSIEVTAENKPLSKEAQEFYKPFTKDNSYTIYSKSTGESIGILSRDLCKAIDGFPANDH